MFGFAKGELKIFRRLTTPKKIQDFLDTIPMNFRDDTCYSPRMVLKERRSHCMEGAMFAACALRMIGHPPLVMDLRSIDIDDDHVVAVFTEGKYFGAISKTNHGVLRYREPIYESIRELAMSYFHEYFLDDGRKTLREFSRPLDLSRFDKRNWMTTEEQLFYIPEYLDAIKHFDMLTQKQIRNLRKADAIERTMGKITEWVKH